MRHKRVVNHQGGPDNLSCCFECSSLLCVPRGTTEVIRSLDPTITAWMTEATPTNGSDENLPPICDENNLITTVLICIIFPLGLAGNASVIWFLGFQMRRNPFYTYILNLAVADFLFLCLHTTFLLLAVIRVFHHCTTLFGILRTVTIFFYIAVMNMIAAISTERCLSVLCPIWYHCHRPRHTSAVICVLLWALSMILSILEAVVCVYFDITVRHLCKNVQFTLAAWLVLLFVILSGSSLALLGRMLCGSQKKPLTRLYVTIMLTVLVFLLCGLPFGVSVFLLWWMEIDFQALFCLQLVSTVLSYVNSSANPIIYFFVGSFRQGFRGQNLKLVVERALQDTPGKNESGGSLSQGTLEMSGSRVEQG
ncbi:mas-related G-protein coupled receptor member X1 [Ictidomys tridecemlineatus]